MEYFVHLIILVAIFSALGISLNLVVGYTGLVSMAHAAFFGIGAYTTAILTTRLDINFFWTVFIALVLAILASLLIGLVLSKFGGDYYALGSFGFSVIVYAIFNNWQELTAGPLGIPGIDAPTFLGFAFNTEWHFLVLALVLLTIVYCVSHFLMKSSFGRVLRAIREDEKAIQVFGYNTFANKLIIFAVSAAMAAVAGSLFASYLTFIDPSIFSVIESIFLLAVVIVGGLASLPGSIVGALVLVLIPELLRFVGLPAEIAGQMRQLIFGLILVVLMFGRPQGLLGKFRL